MDFYFSNHGKMAMLNSVYYHTTDLS